MTQPEQDLGVRLDWLPGQTEQVDDGSLTPAQKRRVEKLREAAFFAARGLTQVSVKDVNSSLTQADKEHAAEAWLQAIEGQSVRLEADLGMFWQRQSGRVVARLESGTELMPDHEDELLLELLAGYIDGADKQVDTLLVKVTKSLEHKGGNDQPRDDQGRFASTGGGGASAGGEYYTLSEDVNSVRMTHVTSAANADAIEADGFGFSSNSMYGKGIYLSDNPVGEGYGDTVLDVKLKPHKQMVLAEDIHVPRAAKELGLDYGAHDFPEKMLAQGIGSMRFPVDNDVYTVVFDKNLVAGTKRSSNTKGFAGQKSLLESQYQAILSQIALRVVGINGTTQLAIQTAIDLGRQRGYNNYTLARGVPADNFPGVRALVQETYAGRAQTVARTELAVLQTQVATTRYRNLGVVEVEIMDGDGCGWTRHDDPDVANGSVRGVDEAERQPISHPNCVRVVLPIIPDRLAADQAARKTEEAPYVGAADYNATLEGIETTKNRGLNGDRVLSEAMQKQGFYSPAGVHSKAEIDAFIAAGERELLRGLSETKFAREFIDTKGTSLYTGNGFHGNGLYSAVAKGENLDDMASTAVRNARARGYADDEVLSLATYQVREGYGADTVRAFGSGQDSVVRMTLRPEARTVTSKELKDLIREESRADPFNFPEALREPGTFATLRGYDAIIVENTVGGVGSDFVVILNRSSIRIQDELWDSEFAENAVKEALK